MNDLKVTLYDVFGYLIPGAFFMLAICLVLWGIFADGSNGYLQIDLRDIPVGVWWVGALVSYVMGHIVHALANILTPIFPRADASCFADGRKIPPKVISTAKAKAESILGVPAIEITDDLLGKLCQHSIPQTENETYELFVYREGFYRGLVVAFAALGLALLIAVVMPAFAIQLKDRMAILSRAFVLTMAGISFVCMYLSLRRYRRFAEYRVLQMFFSFLLREAEKKGG
jgi:hypothetical protein